jgi:uncharacterized cupredoxin-like copper-binding protein
VKAALTILVVLGMALAGCGGEGGDSGTLTAKVMEQEREGIPADAGQWMFDVETDPDGDLAYTADELVTPSGNTNFHLINQQPEGHDLTIEEVGGGSVGTKVVKEGSAWQRVSLYEGKRYVFYCSVPGHRKAGMEGTLRIDPSLKADDLEAY